MKYILTLIITCFTIGVKAQDSTEVHVSAPKIVSKLNFGKSITVEDITFKFVKVVSDSRCPKGVQCVWAGEAVVLVDVIKGGKVVTQETLKFSPSARLNPEALVLFSEKDLRIQGVNLMPYPKASQKIKHEAYYLQLNITP